MDIRLIRLQSGEQVISEIAGQTDDLYSLKNPIALVPTQDGNINFVPWSPLSEEGSLISLKGRNIVYTATPNEELLKNYKEIFSPIITPAGAGKIIT